jgi:DNA-binding transcriptional MocR family regulator
MHNAVRCTDPAKPAPPLGVDALRTALAAEFGCAAESVAITCGTRSALPSLVPFMPAVVFERPSFEDLPFLAQSLGCNVTRVTWDELASVGGKELWITHPSRNPDGANLRPDLADWIAERVSLTVINETYRWSSDSSSIQIAGRLAAVGSLAKIWGPSSRIGWIRGTVVPELPVPLIRTASPPAVHQIAWAQFLREDGLVPLIAEAQRTIESRRHFVEQVGAYVTCPEPDGPSVLVRLPLGLSDDAALERLLLTGIKATAGRHFGADPATLRLTFTGISLTEATRVAESYKALFSSADI